MRTSFFSPLFIAAVFFCGTAPRADATQLTVTATASFPTTYTAFTDTVPTQQVFFPSPAVATITPFNAALGTLDKVSIHWDYGGSFTGTVGTSSGSATFSISGTVYVNTTSYNGGGGDSYVDPNPGWSDLTPAEQASFFQDPANQTHGAIRGVAQGLFA